MHLDNSQITNQNSNHEVGHEIRFRCPCCGKLYQTQMDVFQEVEPEFDCQGCQKSFTLLQNINSFGMYETKTDEYKFSSCPKCNYLMPAVSKECPSCGVFVDKFQKMAQAESPMLYELNQFWSKVIENFDLDQNHQIFLHQCQQKSALSFAFQKYNELHKTMNYDSLCEKYLKQIELRLEQQFLAKRSLKEKNSNGENSGSHLTQWVFAGIGFVGLALLIFNKLKPTFPNLTGLVVSITILSFGLWILSSQNRKNFRN